MRRGFRNARRRGWLALRGGGRSRRVGCIGLCREALVRGLGARSWGFERRSFRASCRGLIVVRLDIELFRADQHIMFPKDALLRNGN